MVTVSAGRNCSSTFRAARRVTVPSGSSSPEQETIPTFFFGKSTILTCLFARDQGIYGDGYLLGKGVCQLTPAFIEFGNPLRLEVLMPPVDIQDRNFLHRLAAAFFHHLARAG